MPALSPRLKHSCTVDRALASAVAICRSLKCASNLSRKTSLIFRIDNLACATVDLLPPVESDDGSRLSRVPLNPRLDYELLSRHG